MSKHSPDEITHLLHQWANGDDRALEALFSAIYPDLRRLANYILRGERKGHTLQPTALVNEAYLKLAGQAKITWQIGRASCRERV